MAKAPADHRHSKAYKTLHEAIMNPDARARARKTRCRADTEEIIEPGLASTQKYCRKPTSITDL
jgi:hypothetical protein